MSVLHDAPRICDNEHAFAIWDKYPMAPGHVLVCTKREIASWFDATHEEQAAVNELLGLARAFVELKSRPTGYTIMINVNGAQHIPHIHAHLIPYYRDTPGGSLRWP